MLRSTPQLLLVAENEHGVGKIALSRRALAGLSRLALQGRRSAAHRGLGTGQRLSAIPPTPCSFSATRRSCGVDRSMASFFSILLMIFLAFPETQSSFPGRCEFWAHFWHHINDFYALKKQQPISIAKTGITTILNARTSLLAAAILYLVAILQFPLLIIFFLSSSFRFSNCFFFEGHKYCLIFCIFVLCWQTQNLTLKT